MPALLSLLRTRHALVAAAVCAASVLAGAQQSWATRPIQPADLSDLGAKGPVRDAVIRTALPARAAQRTEAFGDQHAHQMTISASVDGLDLAPYASVLAGTLHSGEISDLTVWVVTVPEVQAICGADA